MCYKWKQMLKVKGTAPTSVNVLKWNISGNLDEDKTYLLLDTVSSRWPAVQVILLTERHLGD